MGGGVPGPRASGDGFGDHISMPDEFRKLLQTDFDRAPRHLHARVFGLDYVVLDDPRGGRMFVTRYGWPLLEHLCPRAWYDGRRYAADGNRIREGTGAVYHVPTLAAGGRRVDLVVKFSRLGQPVPILEVMREYPLAVPEEALDAAHFRSPFAEFSLVMELRRSPFGPADLRVLTKRPLAVYQTPPTYPLWRLGRESWRFDREAYELDENQRACQSDRRVALAPDHEYVMLFGWVRGENAQFFHRRGLLSEPDLHALTARVAGELEAKGFRVLDNKPQHFILRERRPGELLRRHGELAYALVDFELLERTERYEAWRRGRAVTIGAP